MSVCRIPYQISNRTNSWWNTLHPVQYEICEVGHKAVQLYYETKSLEQACNLLFDNRMPITKEKMWMLVRLSERKRLFDDGFDWDNRKETEIDFEIQNNQQEVIVALGNITSPEQRVVAEVQNAYQPTGRVDHLFVRTH